MQMVGEDLLGYLQEVRAQIALVDAHAQRWSIEHGDDVIEAVFLPRTDPPIEEPSNAVKNYIRARELQDVIAAIVYPDRRGEGYGLGRYEDHAKLDFSRVGDEPDVHFAHASGFMCKSTATAPERLQALVVGAWG